MVKVITGSTKMAIQKAFGHFKNDRPDLGVDEIQNRLSDICGVGRSSIVTILKQGQDNLKTSVSSKRHKTNLFLDHTFKKDLQNLIWQYNLKNEFFTIDRLFTDAQQHLEFKGGRTTLYKIIKSMGYKHKQVNGHKILCEQTHVVASKIKFLRKFLQLKNSDQNLTFVYLDETWIYQNGSTVCRWLHDIDVKSNPAKIRNEGKRFTILNAGCHLSFFEGCDLLLDSNNDDRDYHKTMNGEIFKNWVINQLIPALNKLQRKCVVVMDNAPYYSVQIDKPPTFSCKKSQMQEWLINHNVKITQNLTKKQLWELIKPFRSDNKSYVIDYILKEHGYDVLRLPPYHCQYNPIEMAWGFCKTNYNKHINSQPPSKDKARNLWLESLAKCTPDMWQNFCNHCEKLISEEWTKHMGNLSVENIPPIIISLGESDSESDSCSSDEIMELE